MGYQIAIPSYHRPVTICEKTLAYLASTDINHDKITVFVADRAEQKIYTKNILDRWPEFGGCIEVGKPTLRAQRNFMRHYYKKGTEVFFMDDDLDGLYRTTSKKHVDMKPIKHLDPVIRRGFTICKKIKTTLWGFNPVANPFFIYGKGQSIDLKYIIGACYGEIIDHSKSLDVTLEDKEDYERTIKHFIKNGRVLRYNDIAVKTRYYKEPGGMQVTRTKKRVEDSAKFLAKTYPQYCKMNTSKKNKEFAEIKLIKQ